VLESLWNQLRKGGILVYTDFGTPQGFRYMLDIKEFLLEHFKDDQPTIIAPCPHS